MALDKLNFFKAKRTGTMFDLAHVNGAKKETGYYEGKADIKSLIEDLKKASDKGDNLKDFYYNDYPPISNTSWQWTSEYTTDEVTTITEIPYTVKTEEDEDIRLALGHSLSREIGDVSTQPATGIVVDLDETKSVFSLSFYFTEESAKKIEEGILSNLVDYDPETEKQEKLSNEIQAITFKTGNIEHILLLIKEFSSSHDPIPFFSSVYKDKYDEIGGDGEKRDNFYRQIPLECLTYMTAEKGWISDEKLLDDLAGLLIYDAASWFDDASSSMLKVLQSFSDFKYIYDVLYKSPAAVKSIYSHINSDSGENSKETYCNFLMVLALIYQEIPDIDSLEKVYMGGGYNLDSDLFFGEPDSVRIKLTKSKTTRTWVEPHPTKDWIGGYYRDSTDTQVMFDKQFNPLQMVMLEDKTTGQISIVPAIFVKRLSDIAEWDQVIEVIMIVVTILSMLTSVGILFRGAVGLIRAFAIVDLVVGTVDLALTNDKIRGALEKSGPVGKWFVENWPVISFMTSMGILSAQMARGIIKNGPKMIAHFKNVKNFKMSRKFEELYAQAQKVLEKGLKLANAGDPTKSFFANIDIATESTVAAGKVIGQTKGYTCVANSLRMALDDLKHAFPEEYIASALKTTKEGARILDIPSVLRYLNLDNIQIIVRGGRFDKTVKFSTLAKQMKRGGRRAIVGIRNEKFGAHAVVVDKIENGKVYIRDPLPLGQGSSYSVSVQDFEEMFNRKFVVLKNL